MYTLVGLIYFCLFSICRLEDWCARNCKSEDHVACKYGDDCTPNDPCQLIDLDVDQILEKHNSLRNRFATGQDSHATSVQVADMMALSWDDELAFLASCNLKECTGQMKHDQCHVTKNFDSAGQNLAYSSGINDCSSAYLNFIDSWYREIEKLSESQIHEFGKAYSSISGTGHFTQVVWSRTTHVGCAMTSSGSPTICLFACNYGPAGNVLTTQMYKEGSPASKCPQDLSANSQFSGLCGKGHVPNISSVTLFFILLFFKIAL